MWNYIEKNLSVKINKKSSFYVGNIAGRPNYKYDTDLKFSLNLKIKFFTLEEYFLDDNTKFKSTLTGYQLDNFSTNIKY